MPALAQLVKKLRPSRRPYDPLPLEARGEIQFDLEREGLAAVSACVQNPAQKERILQEHKEREWANLVRDTHHKIDLYKENGATWEERYHPYRNYTKKSCCAVFTLAVFGALFTAGMRSMMQLSELEESSRESRGEANHIYQGIKIEFPEVFNHHPKSPNSTVITCSIQLSANLCLNTPCWLADRVFEDCYAVESLGQGYIRPLAAKDMTEEQIVCLLALYQWGMVTASNFSKLTSYCEAQDVHDAIGGYLLLAFTLIFIAGCVPAFGIRCMQIEREFELLDSPVKLIDPDNEALEGNNLRTEPSIESTHAYLKVEMEALIAKGFFSDSEVSVAVVRPSLSTASEQAFVLRPS